MKLLAAGDIHGDIKLAEILAKKAEDESVDYVVLCGDLTYGEQSTEGIIGPFVKRNQKVMIIPGNHETSATVDFLSQLYKVRNLHGYYVKPSKGDIGIFGAGGANIGLFQLSEDEIFEMLKKGHDEVKNSKTKIMVTHVHPKGSMMEKLTSIFPGSAGVSKALKEFKPDLLLCSHVHEAEGLEETIGNTTVINVGKKGKIIEIG